MPLILTPFRFRSFRRWSAANLISNTGTWMRVLAANWLLLTATGSATQMGIGILMHTVPVLLLGPWAGALADRLPARPLLTITQLCHAGLAALLAATAINASDPVPWIYTAMLAGGVVTAMEGPTLGRFGSTLVDRDHLGPALAVGSLVSSAGRIGGMSLGGMIAAGTGPGLVFAINAATYFAVVAVLYLVRPQPSAVEPGTEVEPPPAAVLAGLRYVLRDPTVLVTLGLAFLLGSLGRNYQVTMAAMSAGPLQGGPDSYGMLSTVFAIGAVVGGLLAARAARMYGRHLVAVGLAMAVLQATSGLAPGLWWFAAAILPIAAAAVVVDTVIATRLQLDQPLAVRGRVLAVLGATGATAGAVGAPVLGWLTDTIGPRPALGAAGLVTATGCVAAAAGYAAARRRAAASAVPADPAEARPVLVATLPMPGPTSRIPAPRRASRTLRTSAPLGAPVPAGRTPA